MALPMTIFNRQLDAALVTIRAAAIIHMTFVLAIGSGFPDPRLGVDLDCLTGRTHLITLPHSNVNSD